MKNSRRGGLNRDEYRDLWRIDGRGGLTGIEVVRIDEGAAGVVIAVGCFGTVRAVAVGRRQQWLGGHQTGLDGHVQPHGHEQRERCPRRPALSAIGCPSMHVRLNTTRMRGPVRERVSISGARPAPAAAYNRHMNKRISGLGIFALALLALGCERSDTGSDAVEAPVDLPLESLPGARLPRLVEHPDGGLWISWVEPLGEGVHVLRYARLVDGRWSDPITVAEGTDWFVNWADFPSVLPLAGGSAAAHWLVKRAGGPYAYDIAVAVSGDGQSWRPPVVPHGDGTATEHGFVTLYPDDGAVGAVWLDGRHMATDAGAHGDGQHGGGGAMTLRAGLIDSAGIVLSETELDPRTCDCCQTDVAVTDDGPVVVYRDRSEDEVRDIQVIVRRDGAWSPPRDVARDGWRIEACPVNGPAIATDGSRLAVAWFTAADDRPRVRAAFSDDGADSFGEPIEVATDGAIGRVGIVLLDENAAVVSWVASSGSGAEIRYRRIAPDGSADPVRTLVHIDASRTAGFPQLARGGDGLVFAWTTPGEPANVETATVTLHP